MIMSKEGNCSLRDMRNGSGNGKGLGKDLR